MSGSKIRDDLFITLVERASPRLRAVLRTFRIAREDSDDLLQEALLALWRKKDEVSDPEAWLVGALRTECLRYRQRQHRQRCTAVDLEQLDALAGSCFEALDLHQDLMRHLARLPPRQRALLHLRFQLGLTPGEVAVQLGYRPSSLKKTTTRCLQALSRELMESGFARRGSPLTTPARRPRRTAPRRG